MAMTGTREMEQDPNPREVEQLIFRLERPAQTEYSFEISARALQLLKTRSHNEWLARLNAEESARVAEEYLADARKELAYCRKWNTRMVAVLAILIGVIALLVWRSSERSEKGRDLSAFAQMRQR